MGRGLIAALVAPLVVAGAALALTAGDEGQSGAPPPVGAATDRWAPLASAPLARTEVAAARIGRSIYVVGGFEERSGQTTGALERYDIRRDRWERLRSIPVGVNHSTAVAHRGRLYVHGGYRGRRDLSSATPALFEYQPGRDRWRRLPPAPTPRAAHAAAVIAGRLYVAGGSGARGDLRSLEVYDFGRRRWRRGPSMRGPARNHTTGVAAQGFFYVLAGRTSAGNFRVAERYEPRRRRWRLLPSMQRARGGIASAALSRGRVVVFGGEELTPGGTTIREVELFNPRSRRWRRLPDMLTPRHGLGGVSLRNRVYAIEGGPQPGFHFSSALEFLDVR